MNAITTVRGNQLPAIPPPVPEISAAMRVHLTVADYRLPGETGPMKIARPSPGMELVAEARGLLSRWAERMRPATRDAVERWLVPIAAAVRNPPHPDEMDARMTSVALACSDLPWWAFNDRSHADAVRAFQFWPAAADVRALLVNHIKPVTERLDALRLVADFVPPRDAPAERIAPEMTAEERAEAAKAARQAIDKLKAELDARREEEAPPRTAPALSRATLTAIREHEAKHGPSVPVRHVGGGL